MKKINKIVLGILGSLALFSFSIFFLYNYFYDKNNLSVAEEQWISENKTKLIDIDIPKNINMFSIEGDGIFFEFIEYLEEETELSFNKNLYDKYTDNGNLSFSLSKDSNLLFHEDYYVVLSTKDINIHKYEEIENSKVGTTSTIIPRITKVYKSEMEYITVDNYDKLFKDLTDGKLDYIVVPKLETLDMIISNNLFVNYHLSDLLIKYSLNLTENKTLNNIIVKKFNVFSEEYLEELYNDYLLDIMRVNLDISTESLDSLTNKVYKFGYKNATPYFISTGNYNGGIINSYLDDFSKLTNVEFKYNRYKTNAKLLNAYKNKKTDLIFSGVINENNYKIKTNLKNKYYIVSSYNKYINILSLSEIDNRDIFVLKDTILYGYLNKKENLNVNVVKNDKELYKKIKQGELVAIDANTFDYQVNKKIKDAKIRYEGYGDNNYIFSYINDDDAFYKLFSTFINLQDDKLMINNGIRSFKSIDHGKNLTRDTIKYLLFSLLGVVIAAFAYYSRKSNIMIKTKIRKDDKLKFIDVLTSLKNRNYLNEMKDAWNKSKVYPQTIILIDLNNVKHLNDTYGHTEGDKQIIGMANILLKMQIDNTEIIRSDGNEFIIYMMTYNEKQVLNYIKRLMKALKKLPYDYGASVGFQMIHDESMLIDDAINEAFNKMKENKKRMKRDK